MQILPLLSDEQLLYKEMITLALPQINLKAAAAAVMASVFFQKILPISLAHWNHAMRNVSIPGRQQLIEGTVSTLYDVAHNPQAVSLLAEYIRCYLKKSKVHAVFSCLNDKDLRGLIKPMHSYVDFWYPAVLSSKRAVDECALKMAFQAENLLVSMIFKDPMAAYLQAVQRAKPGDLIVVFGSFFYSVEFVPLLGKMSTFSDPILSGNYPDLII